MIVRDGMEVNEELWGRAGSGRASIRRHGRRFCHDRTRFGSHIRLRRGGQPSPHCGQRLPHGLLADSNQIFGALEVILGEAGDIGLNDQIRRAPPYL
jgi:hypothetical protein